MGGSHHSGSAVLVRGCRPPNARPPACWAGAGAGRGRGPQPPGFQVLASGLGGPQGAPCSPGTAACPWPECSGAAGGLREAGPREGHAAQAGDRLTAALAPHSDGAAGVDGQEPPLRPLRARHAGPGDHGDHGDQRRLRAPGGVWGPQGTLGTEGRRRRARRATRVGGACLGGSPGGDPCGAGLWRHLPRGGFAPKGRGLSLAWSVAPTRCWRVLNKGARATCLVPCGAGHPTRRGPPGARQTLLPSLGVHSLGWRRVGRGPSPPLAPR